MEPAKNADAPVGRGAAGDLDDKDAITNEHTDATRTCPPDTIGGLEFSGGHHAGIVGQLPTQQRSRVVLTDELEAVVAGAAFGHVLFVPDDVPDAELAELVGHTIEIVSCMDGDGKRWADELAARLARMGADVRIREFCSDYFDAIGEESRVGYGLHRLITDTRGLDAVYDLPTRKTPEWWPDIVLPWAVDLVPEPYPEGIFTGPVAQMVSAVVESSHAPIDFASATVLGIGAICGQRRYRVASPTHTTSPALFVVMVARSGMGKSGSVNPCMAPMYRWLERHRAELEVLAEEEAGDDDDAEKPYLPHFIADNGTPEAIRRMMQYEPAAVVSTEGGRVLRIIDGMYSRGAGDPSVYLRGYDGDYLAAELRRGEESGGAAVDYPRLSMILATHAGTVAALGPALREQGFWARSLITAPAPLGAVNVRDLRQVPSSVRQAYEQHLEAMLDHTAAASDRDGTKTLELSATAREIYFDAWQRYKDAAKAGDLEDWHSRAHEHVLRVSEAIWMLEHGWKRPNVPLSGSIITRAVRLVDYHTAHWRRLFGSTGESSDARKVWDWLCAQNKPQNLRAIYRESPVRDRARAEIAVDELEEAGAIRPRQDGRTVVYDLNPKAKA